MYETYEQIKAAFIDAADKKYNDFNSKIVNSAYPCLGVRVPHIKKMVKACGISRRDEILDDFFADGEKSFEAVLFAGMLAALKGSYEKTCELLKRIIPLFGSWAHVDCTAAMLGWVDKNRFADDFYYLLSSAGEYEKRMYLIFLFEFAQDETARVIDILENKTEYGQYYVDMGAAWLAAECLIKNYEVAVGLVERRSLPKFVHNKTIQKARESYRVSDERKSYLNTLKIK